MLNDPTHILDLVDELTAGWLAGDGKRFAAPFGERAHFVAFDGTVLTGPSEIAAFHQKAFDTHLRGTALDVTVEEVRPVAERVWLVFASGGISKIGGSTAERTGESVQTYLCREEEGKIYIEAFQNTRVRPVTDQQSAEVWRAFDELWQKRSK